MCDPLAQLGTLLYVLPCDGQIRRDDARCMWRHFLNFPDGRTRGGNNVCISPRSPACIWTRYEARGVRGFFTVTVIMVLEYGGAEKHSEQQQATSTIYILRTKGGQA
jgi:hypothetical protein